MTVALLRLTTPALLPPITPSIDWLVHLSPHRLRGPICRRGDRLQGRVTRPRQQRPKWFHRVQSGRTGRGTGGRSGNCCPRTMLTHCLKRWCDELHHELQPASSWPGFQSFIHGFHPFHELSVPLLPWRCCLRVQLLPYTDFNIQEPLVFHVLYGCSKVAFVPGQYVLPTNSWEH